MRPKWTLDREQKKALAQELYFLLGKAGLLVSNISYCIGEYEDEWYIVRMRTGKVYKISVTADKPLQAVLDVLKYMNNKY